jgi:hypothetical protein
MQVPDHPCGQVVAAKGTTDLPLLLQAAQDPYSRAVARFADRARGPEHVIELPAGAEVITAALGDAVIPPPSQLVQAGSHSDEGYFVPNKGLVLIL